MGSSVGRPYGSLHQSKAGPDRTRSTSSRSASRPPQPCAVASKPLALILSEWWLSSFIFTSWFEQQENR